MAGFNEIQHGRVNRFFQKWGGIKGRPPTSSLGAEVTPQLAIASGVEDRYLQSWDVFSAVGFPAAVAGQNSSMQLRNPAGSGVLAVIEKIVVWTITANGEHRLTKAVFSTDLTVIVTAQNNALDARGRQKPTIIPSIGNFAGSGDLTLILESHGISGAFLDVLFNQYPFQEWPLLPGDAYRVVNETANQASNITMRWRERSLEDAEKT